MEFSDYIQLQNLIGKTLEHSCAGSVLALLEGDLTLVDQTTYDLVNNNRDAVMSPYFSEHNGYGWELLDIGGINHEGNIKYNDVYTWIDFGGGDNDGSDPGTGNEDGESDDDHTFKFWCPIACKQSYVLALSSEGDTKEDALKALLSMLTETLQRTKMAMMHS